MIIALCKICFPLLLLSYLSGEVLAPPSERLAQKLRLKAQNAEVSVKEFRSGIWVKDERSFINAKQVLPDTSLLDISIYEFDERYHLRSITLAKHAVFVAANHWQLENVLQTRFSAQGSTVTNLPAMEWRSVLNPELLGMLLATPKQMSVWRLYQYTQHLRDNHQKTARYEVAMWNKVLYPPAVLIMMLLALPFAAQRSREGGVSAKIFLGIVLGLSFHFVGQLTTNLGALNEWSPLLSALAVPLLFLLLAAGMLWWTERR